MAQAKKQNFLHGAAIMTATTVLVKIVAFCYKMPLGSMSLLGDEGYAHFLVAYNIYSFFLMLATAGFPVALSRMISAADTLNRPYQVQRIFNVALRVLAVIGGIFSLIMLLFHAPLAKLIGDADASYSILALSPTVLLVCLTSAYRGYCQGRGNMIPTAFGQVVEECGKLIIGLTLAWILVHAGKSLDIASAGAIFGVTAGALAALIFMWVYKRRNYPVPAVAEEGGESSKSILKEFLKIGIPIALGSSVLSLVNLLDNALCLNRLQSAAGFSSSMANTLYGVYGKAQTFYNLPSYFITPLTLSIVPAIVAALTKGKREEAGFVAEDALRISAVIALPMSIGLSVLSEPVFKVVYWGSNEAGHVLLRTLGIAAFFVCMAMIQNAVLQAAGKERLPIISIAVGGAVKIGVNWFLVGNPNININGAPIGSICCFFVICLMDYLFLCKHLASKPRLSRILGAPLLSSLAMGVTAWGVYAIMTKLLSGSGELTRMPMLVAMVVAIVAAVIVYGIMIGITRALTLDDMNLIPKGDKIGKLLHLKSK